MPTKTSEAKAAPRKALTRKVVVGPDRGRVRLTAEPLTAAEEQGPFDPHRLYRLDEIHEGLTITPLQARRWVYYDGRLPYVQLTGKGRRFRGRDLNKFINDRVVVPEGR